MLHHLDFKIIVRDGCLVNTFHIIKETAKIFYMFEHEFKLIIFHLLRVDFTVRFFRKTRKRLMQQIISLDDIQVLIRLICVTTKYSNV